MWDSLVSTKGEGASERNPSFLPQPEGCMCEVRCRVYVMPHPGLRAPISAFLGFCLRKGLTQSDVCSELDLSVLP